MTSTHGDRAASRAASRAPELSTDAAKGAAVSTALGTDARTVPQVDPLPEASRDTRLQNPVLAISLIILGVIGFVAAFALTLDKFALLENPNADLGCNFSLLVGCSTNLNSAQGEVFGFPNSLLGIVFWTGTLTIGFALLAGAQLARWFWALFALATTGSLALVVWFIGQSLFELHVLCPWCMVTWAVTIPTFFVVILHALRSGAVPMPLVIRRFAQNAYGWIPLATLVSYVIVAALAQWRLDVITALFG